MAKLRFNVAGEAMRVLLIFILIFIVLDVLNRFNIFTTPAIITTNFVVVVASFFILVDIGIKNLIRGKGDIVDYFLGGMSTIALITVVVNAIGVPLSGFFLTLQGVVVSFLGVALAISIFKR